MKSDRETRACKEKKWLRRVLESVRVYINREGHKEEKEENKK